MPAAPTGPPTIRPAAVGEILGLRHRVLRAGLPAEAARFEGDDEPRTIHLAAVEGGGAVVGCLSLLRRPWVADGGEGPAWQLRGMAVDPSRQRSGVGGALLAAAEGAAAASGGPTLMWCNARKIALGFYETHGWRVASDEFDIPTAGPHRRMTRHIVLSPSSE